jgi:hypothetical protein
VNTRGKPPAASIVAEAEQTLREHDFSLSEDVYAVGGELDHAARARSR